jgi:hypothetical protein
MLAEVARMPRYQAMKKYTMHGCDIGIRWMLVVSFTIQELYPSGKGPRYAYVRDWMCL